MTVHCPICSKPYDSKHGCVMHIYNSQQGEHGEIDDYAQAESMVLDISGDTQEDTEGDTKIVESDGSGIVPSDGQKIETDTKKDTETNGGCPACGSNKRYDAFEVATDPRCTQEQKELLMQSDYVCADCGGVYDAN